jgi:hypothetical protein
LDRCCRVGGGGKRDQDLQAMQHAYNEHPQGILQHAYN